MIARYLVLRGRLAKEWKDAQRAAAKAIHAFELARRRDAETDVYLDSTAMNLHGFYSGVERMFESIGREVDGGLPQGGGWHRDLLVQMTLAVEDVRPRVIRAETGTALEDYLRFRHLVRNLYTWSLQPDRVADLVLGLPALVQETDTDLSAFLDFLAGASRADEQG